LALDRRRARTPESYEAAQLSKRLAYSDLYAVAGGESHFIIGVPDEI
jgi:hypothetical protein